MKSPLLPALFVSLALLSCDREATNPTQSASGTFSLAPRIATEPGVVLSQVDSVHILVRNKTTLGSVYEASIDWNRHGDTIKGIAKNLDLRVVIEGIKVQPDGTKAIWWSGTAEKTFSGLQTLDIQSLTVPVSKGDTVAPAMVSRNGDTVQNTADTLRLSWHLVDANLANAVVNGDTVQAVGDSLVWKKPWPSGGSFPVLAWFHDKSGNALRDTLTATRRDRVAKPTIVGGSRTKNDTVHLALSDSTPNAAIQYSFDRGASWHPYDTVLVIGSNLTLYARASKTGLTGSSIDSATFAIAVDAPDFSVATGTDANDLLALVLSSKTPGATLEYSTDSANWLAIKDTLVLGNSTSLWARAAKAGVSPSPVAKANYSIRAALDSSTAKSGTYHTYRTVRLKAKTPGAQIRYTLDGSLPAPTSPLYADSLIVDSSCTLKWAAFKPGLTTSAIDSATFSLTFDDTIVVSIPDTTTLWFARKTGLSMSSKMAATFHCTTDGSEAVANSPLCDSATVGEGAVVKVLAFSKLYPRLPAIARTFRYPTSWNTRLSFDTLRDTRDGQVYRTVKIGTRTWMAQNLNYQADSSVCPALKADSCKKSGRLYSWSSAMGLGNEFTTKTWGGGDISRQGVCDIGWHLPSQSEWDTLQNLAHSNTAELAASKGWSNLVGTDDFGFRALPAGGDATLVAGEHDFTEAGITAEFWTSSEDKTLATGAAMSILYDNKPASISANFKVSGASVRCVKND